MPSQEEIYFRFQNAGVVVAILTGALALFVAISERREHLRRTQPRRLEK
jgi:hypothetical protein